MINFKTGNFEISMDYDCMLHPFIFSQTLVSVPHNELLLGQ
jgi:hypothetical protein